MRAQASLTMFFLMLACAAAPVRAEQSPYLASLREVPRDLDGEGAAINGLSFDRPDRLEVRTEWAEGIPRPVAVIRGKFKRPGWNLALSEAQFIAGESEGEFRFEIPLRAREQSLEFLAIGAHSAESQAFIVDFDAWERFREKELGRALARPRVALGATWLRYREDGLADFRLLSATVKVAATHRFGDSRWNAGGNLYLSQPLSGGPADHAVRFLGINLRGGYAMPLPEALGGASWSLSLSGGLYFAHMFVTGNAFGYSHLLYPQLYPSLRKNLGAGSSVGFHMKYVPVSKEPRLIELQERELAAGLEWESVRGAGKALSVSLDFASLRFRASAAHSVSSESLTCSVGWGL
ncbi:MAG: hypothetical protein NDJ89_11180 [Oligoflexia bacterium]|nr:hypothetical protein [Oligoflexia bacterium]